MLAAHVEGGFHHAVWPGSTLLGVFFFAEAIDLSSDVELGLEVFQSVL